MGPEDDLEESEEEILFGLHHLHEQHPGVVWPTSLDKMLDHLPESYAEDDKDR